MLWRGRLPPPAPEILRGLAALKVSAISMADELAANARQEADRRALEFRDRGSA